MISLVVATKNEHKVREISEMLEGHAVAVKSLFDYPGYDSPDETGFTFLENARIKARSLRQHLLGVTTSEDFFVLADDSGLSCNALNGGPGVLSARFSGPTATAAENNHKLVSFFREHPQNPREAHYTCAMVLILPDGSEQCIEEYCFGEIITEPKGHNGFGYDPYFFLKDHQQTMAELPAIEKNRISHRGKALQALVEFLLKQNHSR